MNFYCVVRIVSYWASNTSPESLPTQYQRVRVFCIWQRLYKTPRCDVDIHGWKANRLPVPKTRADSLKRVPECIQNVNRDTKIAGILLRVTACPTKRCVPAAVWCVCVGVSRAPVPTAISMRNRWCCRVCASVVVTLLQHTKSLPNIRQLTTTRSAVVSNVGVIWVCV